MSLRLVAVLGTWVATIAFASACSEARMSEAGSGDASTDAAEVTSTVAGDDRGKPVEWRHAFFGFVYGGPGAPGTEASANPATVLVVVLTNRADHCTVLAKLKPRGETDPSLAEGSLGFNATVEGAVARSPRLGTEGGGAAEVELAGIAFENADAPFGPAQNAAIGLDADVSVAFYDSANNPNGSAHGRMAAERCEALDYGRQ